jgi:hypothetical protein
MSYAVVFHENGARIFQGINPDDYKGVPNVLIDPVLPPGVPPHEWKLVDGKIEVQSEDEKKRFMRAFDHCKPANGLQVVRPEFDADHIKQVENIVITQLSLHAVAVNKGWTEQLETVNRSMRTWVALTFLSAVAGAGLGMLVFRFLN